MQIRTKGSLLSELLRMFVPTGVDGEIVPRLMPVIDTLNKVISELLADFKKTRAQRFAFLQIHALLFMLVKLPYATNSPA